DADHHKGHAIDRSNSSVHTPCLAGRPQVAPQQYRLKRVQSTTIDDDESNAIFLGRAAKSSSRKGLHCRNSLLLLPDCRDSRAENLLGGIPTCASFGLASKMVVVAQR